MKNEKTFISKEELLSVIKAVDDLCKKNGKNVTVVYFTAKIITAHMT